MSEAGPKNLQTHDRQHILHPLRQQLPAFEKAIPRSDQLPPEGARVPYALRCQDPIVAGATRRLDLPRTNG